MFLHLLKKHKTFFAGLIITVTVGGVFIVGANSQVDPGGEEDPFISESLLNLKIGELSKKIQETDKKIEAILKMDTSSNEKFEVIEVKKGNSIICGDSAEIILRSGKATAIGSKAGGLADLTSDSDGDLKEGRNVPQNHLILIPRDDGRGIKITSLFAWVMIKGKYEIK